MIVRLILLVGVVWTALPLSARTWTDVEGRKVEADLLRVDGDKAIVKLRDKEVPLTISRLSDDDQRYVDLWKKDNPVTASAKSSPASKYVICKTELKPDGEIITIETRLPARARSTIAKSLARFPELVAKIPFGLRIGIALPAGFDPSKPQRVLWVGIDQRLVYAKADRLLVAMNWFAKDATDAGWVVLAVDTDGPFPEGPGTGGDIAFRRNQSALNHEAAMILGDAWPGFKQWQLVCCGIDAGAVSSQYWTGFMQRSKLNLIGMFLAGMASDWTDDIMHLSGCNKGDLAHVAVFLSIPHRSWTGVAIEPIWKSHYSKLQIEYWDEERTVDKAAFRKALAWFSQ